MTQLDRAFIKAFSESAPHAAGRARRAEEGAGAQGVSSTPDVAMLAAAPRASARSPKAKLMTTERPASDMETVRPQSSAATAPLSTFAATANLQEPFRALLEVDHLAWPEACDHLLAQAGEAWGLFADQLVEQLRLGRKCFALGSCQRGEGRTTISLALAKYLATRGVRSVVVDADFENPSLARSCDISVHAGWDDFLEGEPLLGEALISAVEDGVTLMPWRGAAIRVGALASSLRAATGFSTLREHYDLVLLDVMPLVGQTTISDFASFAESIHLDAVFLVQDVRTTTPENLASACAKLRRVGLHVAGVIENFIPAASLDSSSASETSQSMAGHKLVTYG